MHCNSCGAQNPDGVKFCNSCGARLITDKIENSASSQADVSASNSNVSTSANQSSQIKQTSQIQQNSQFKRKTSRTNYMTAPIGPGGLKDKIKQANLQVTSGTMCRISGDYGIVNRDAHTKQSALTPVEIDLRTIKEVYTIDIYRNSDKVDELQKRRAVAGIIGGIGTFFLLICLCLGGILWLAIGIILMIISSIIFFNAKKTEGGFDGEYAVVSTDNGDYSVGDPIIASWLEDLVEDAINGKMQ